MTQTKTEENGNTRSTLAPGGSCSTAEVAGAYDVMYGQLRAKEFKIP